MVKTIVFNNALKVYKPKKSYLMLYDTEDDYELVFSYEYLNRKKDNIRKHLYMKENNNVLFSYRMKENWYGYNNFKSSYLNFTNDEIFTESIRLGAYKSNITNKHIPNQMLDKAYELLTMMVNKQEFQVVSNKEAEIVFYV